MHATIGAARWLGYTFRNTFSIKLRLYNYVDQCTYYLSVYIHTYIQAAMLKSLVMLH